VSCQEIRQKLAAYRELSAAEQDQIQEHLRGCSSCTEALAAYQAQDQLLSSLPLLSPTPDLIRAVHQRTLQQRPHLRSVAWRWAPAALSLMLIFSLMGGIVAAAADALPGDALYSVKRAAEQVRLALTLQPATRDRYQQALVQERREEAREVIRLGRQARVEFQGTLMSVQDDVWLVDALPVMVSLEAWAGAPPPRGSKLFVQAYAINGELQAYRISVLPPEVPTPCAGPDAPGSPSPTRTRTGTPSPQHTCTATPQRIRTAQPKSGPSPTSPMPVSSPTASATLPSGPGPHFSVTPGAGGLSPQPSVTPGRWGPGEQPTATPGSWAPSPQPSATPGTWGPGEQPTATPGSWGPSPQPSATPGPSGPGPR